MSSTTPNIGLTKTTAAETIGQNWAASNDSGGNFDIIDTKMGAVGNTSLQAQVTALNSNKANTACFKSSEAVFAPASVGNQTETVTFPTAFENVPVVMATWKDTPTVLAHMSFLTITSVSKTGFTIATERKNASAGWRFAWFAFSPNG